MHAALDASRFLKVGILWAEVLSFEGCQGWASYAELNFAVSQFFCSGRFYRNSKLTIFGVQI